ncbi:HlyD family type I secretion periplasmic adaptor subunit [Sphingobium aquiterrae]|uniref:HlyD family type I secretion periplasmic adaptor subunit n=1 Tax=Sphingobium aquiterrae TaxID=2038656 RepID=UPI0030171FE8
MNAVIRHWDVVRAAIADEKQRAKQLTRTDEISFLPAALEIIERPVSPTARATTWIFLVGLLLTLLWLTFGKVDVVASAQGRLIPADNVKIIQSAEAGIVRTILVRDGQRVRKGEPLVELDPTVSTAEAVQAAKALETAELDAARARAVLSALESNGLQFSPPPGTSAAITSTQRALALAQLQEIEAGISGLGADQRAAVSARDEALTQAAKLTETLPLLDQQIAANEELLAKGYVSKLKVIEMRRQRLIAARDRDAALQAAARVTAQLSSVGSGVARNRAEGRVRVLSDLAKAESDARLRREELTKARQKSSLQRLLSPVNGTVSQLSIHTIGGVVEGAKPIMVVVPTSGPLVAEVRVLNKDIGFVRARQEVAVKFEAFPFTRHGTVPGRVQSISSDAIEDEKLGLVYTVRVGLDRATINRGDVTVALTPGMAATADIKTGERNIISYLVSPINQVSHDAGRER